jgi:hypothetical protein
MLMVDVRLLIGFQTLLCFMLCFMLCSVVDVFGDVKREAKGCVHDGER